jgi:hypothetical protein
VTTPATEGSTDDVDIALDDLAQAVEDNATDERLLVGRIRRARRERAEGRSWRAILESEPDPGMLEVLGRVSSRLSGAGGALRRSLAVALRGEGTTISAVGRMFGVSHQRISKLLTHQERDEPEAAES